MIGNGRASMKKIFLIDFGFWLAGFIVLLFMPKFYLGVFSDFHYFGNQYLCYFSNIAEFMQSKFIIFLAVYWSFWAFYHHFVFRRFITQSILLIHLNYFFLLLIFTFPFILWLHIVLKIIRVGH